MKTISILFLTVSCLCITSCKFNINYPSEIEGEGDVISEHFDLKSFNNLELERGWDVTIIPSSTNYMLVEANENLFEVLEFESDSGTLKIGASKSIGKADAKLITLYFSENLDRLEVSSGVKLTSVDDLIFKNLIMELSSGCNVELSMELKSLNLQSSSGSEASLDLNSNDLSVQSSSGSKLSIEANSIMTTASASSGSSITLRGETNQLDINSSSGSRINSRNFKANSIVANASSGSGIFIYPLERLKASSSSGGSVFYYNTPSESLIVNESNSGGSIKLKQ
jgi:hypothetical protein